MDGADDNSLKLRPPTEVLKISRDVPILHTTDRDGDDIYLPPEPLRPLTDARISHLVAVIIVSLAITILVPKALAFASGRIFDVPAMSQDCGGYSVPSIERGFYINWQVPKTLAFAEAKLLDLAWDTIIGQGGKFVHIEVCWVLGCFGMWFDVHINSTLFRVDRRSSGVARNIFDIASTMQRDLGYDTGSYKNEELKQVLDKCPPVGYEIDASGKVERIAIVSMPGPRRRRSQPRIEPNIPYA